MRALLVVLLLVLGICHGAAAAPAMPATPVTHVVLLDVSGSLRSRHYAENDASGQGRWTPTVPALVKNLLSPGGPCRATDRVLLVPFSDEKTDAELGRHEIGPFELSEGQRIDGAMKAMVIDGATNLPRALQKGKDLAGQNAPAVIWMITDNENNLAGNKSDDEFYKALRDDPSIGHVNVFPLGQSRDDSLVLYQVVPGGLASLAETLSDMVTARIKVGTVLFRPIVATADEGQLSVSSDVQLYVDGAPAGDDRVSQEAGTIRLHFGEGEDLHGQLRFRIHSNLMHWKIVNATIRKAQMQLEIPAPFSGSEESVKAGAQVKPRTLSVDPQQNSAETYLVDLENLDPPAPSPVRLARAGMSNLVRGELADLTGTIELSVDVTLDPTGASTMQPAVDAETMERLKRVPQLDQITRFMIFHADPNAKTKDFSLDLQRKLVIDVASRGIPMWPIFAAGGIGALGLGSWSWMFARPRPYRLTGPSLDDDVSIGLFKSAAVTAGAMTVGTIVMGLRGLTFRPTDGEPQRLEPHDGEYAFEVDANGAVHHYKLSSIDSVPPSGHEEEGPFL